MDTITIAVRRRARPSEKYLKTAMAVLAVLFLVNGILLSTGFMLPCFLMTGCYYWYTFSIKREYEYILEDGWMYIDRVSDRGRRRLHEFKLSEIRLLCLPDDPEAAPYKKGGSEKIKKFDYTSYEDGVAYYTMIVEQGSARAKFLLDLTGEAVARIRRENLSAVKC